MTPHYLRLTLRKTGTPTEEDTVYNMAIKFSKEISLTDSMMGTLYNMRVYDKALTAAQVKAHYTTYRGNYEL